MIAGFIRSGLDPSLIRVGEPDPDRRRNLEREFGVQVESHNDELALWAEVVLVAIRPADLEAVLTPLRDVWRGGATRIVSLAAGVTTAQLRPWIPRTACLFRAMPNLAVELGRGAIALYAPDPVPEAERIWLASLFGRLGTVFWLTEEDQLNRVTAVSGSGPAYFYYFMEQLVQAAVAIGMEEDLARALVLETGMGSMAIAQAGEGEFRRLREQVTSPGGTTAAALRHLARAEFSESIAAAVQAAYERGRELALPQAESKP